MAWISKKPNGYLVHWRDERRKVRSKYIKDAADAESLRQERADWETNVRATVPLTSSPPTRAERPPIGTPCESCGRGDRSLVWDHNHESGAFRGWLCSTCNSGIGMLGDDIFGILAAARYLADVSLRVPLVGTGLAS